MKRLTLLLCSILTLFALNLTANSHGEFEANASAKVKELVAKYNLKVVDYAYVKKTIGKGTHASAKAVVLDARPLKMYQMGHIPSAVSLPDNKFDEVYETALKGVDKSKKIIIYCGGFDCAKSPKLAAMLQKKGHTNLRIYAAGMPQWSAKSYDEINLSVAHALFEKRSAFFIDARPYKTFLRGSIIGSVSIPDTEFKEFTGFLPSNINTPIVAFCGGYECAKSHNIANTLVSMGYQNVKVLASGYPSWKAASYPTTGSAPVAVASDVVIKDVDTFLKKGEDTGTVDGDWFVANYQTFPQNVAIIDVRSADEFNNGHIKNALNINSEKMKAQELLAAIPKDKEVIFYCGTGTRAMEAWGMLVEELKYENAHQIFYLDANIKCDKQNSCTIEPNEPLGI
jgi:rhodanese-related sulfurtransferase